jgi:hypothetical protein
MSAGKSIAMGTARNRDLKCAKFQIAAKEGSLQSGAIRKSGCGKPLWHM